MLGHAPLKTMPVARRAFTLIELLVTVAIMATLVAISVGAYFALMGSTRANVTKTALSKLQKSLDKQWKAVTDEARKETLPSGGFPNQTGDPDGDRAQWIMLRQRQAFPISFAEVWSPNTTTDLPALPGFQQYLSNVGVTASNYNTLGTSAELQSSICLLMALQRGSGFSAADLGKDTVKSFDINAGTTPLPEALADGWGQPIGLLRTWPPSYPTMGYTVTGQTQPQMRMYLVSSGPDKAMGLIGWNNDPSTNMPLPVPGNPDANDNLFSQP